MNDEKIRRTLATDIDESGHSVCAPRDYYEPDKPCPTEDTLTERDRKLKVRRVDYVAGRVGIGASVSPYSPIGLSAYIKWWPCISGLAFQVSTGPVQMYVCWIFNHGGRYRA